MGMKSLKAARKRATADKFEEGTVIRWLASGKYLYAAMKTPVGWVSTSRYNNGHVPITMTFDELLEVLSRSEVTEVVVSETWTQVD